MKNKQDVMEALFEIRSIRKNNMANYYLDIETTSLSPKDGKIISIQYQKLDFNTKEPAGPLVILKEWESSEKEILEKFAKVFGPAEEKWSFVAHGYNLHFENKFLEERSIANGIAPIKLFSKPSFDLHPVGILMNKGQFKGSGLDKISGKEGNGLAVIGLYENKEYSKIDSYVIQEAAAYIKLLGYLVKNMEKVLLEFREDCI